MFEYFSREDVDQVNFIRIPRVMMKDADFAGLSIQAKILYGLLLDRLEQVIDNQWIDERGYAYVIYPYKAMQEDLGVSRKTAGECLAELESFGLVEKKVRGGRQPSILYVKNFIPSPGSNSL